MISWEELSIRRDLVRRSVRGPDLVAMVPPAPRGELPMRFMCIVTSSEALAPSPALLEAMHKLREREIKAGRMLDDGGLMPLATGARVRIADGKLSVIDGPFVEAKEIIGGYAIFELQNKEEAVALTVEFMQLHKDLMPGWEGTCELRAFASQMAS